MLTLSLVLKCFGPDTAIIGTTPPSLPEFDTEVGAIEWDTEQNAGVVDTTP